MCCRSSLLTPGANWVNHAYITQFSLDGAAEKHWFKNSSLPNNYTGVWIQRCRNGRSYDRVREGTVLATKLGPRLSLLIDGGQCQANWYPVTRQSYHGGPRSATGSGIFWTTCVPRCGSLICYFTFTRSSNSQTWTRVPYCWSASWLMQYPRHSLASSRTNQGAVNTADGKSGISLVRFRWLSLFPLYLICALVAGIPLKEPGLSTILRLLWFSSSAGPLRKFRTWPWFQN